MLIVVQERKETIKLLFYFWFIGSFNYEIKASKSWPDNEKVLEYIFFIKIAKKFHIPDLRVEEHLFDTKKQVKNIS